MPDFDGTGPLKRGRVIGRGLGPCRKQDIFSACKDCKSSEAANQEKPVPNPSLTEVK